MPTALPRRFVSVDTAKRSQGYHNLIGVVVDSLSKSRTSGTSSVVTFTIKDSDIAPGNATWKGLKIKYFNDDEHRLPDVQLNDVILLRRLKVRPFSDSMIGVVGNTDNVPWAIFRPTNDPGSLVIPVCSPGSKELTTEEQNYANSLLETVVRSRSGVSETPSSKKGGHAQSLLALAESSQNIISTSRSDRFALIKDLSANSFADLVVHVVKTWYQDERVHLYVTDYTINKSLFDYAESSDEEDRDAANNGLGFLTRATREKRRWQGPKGRMTLQVMLWEPHSYFARENVHEGDYVSLRNVHIKPDNNGRLEGVMHTDRKYPEKVDIKTPEDGQHNDPRFVELKNRKREYWKQNRTNKRKINDDFGDGNEGGSSKAKAKKKRKEQQRQRKQQEQRKQQVNKPPPAREEGQTEMPATVNKSNRPNPYIQAKDPARSCRKISEILLNESHNISLPNNIQYRLPFQCIKYRTTVRVVDFFPPNVADFCVPYMPRSSPSSPQSSEDEDEIAPETPGVRWEWRFCLLVEDAQILPSQPRKRIKLFVSGSDAEFLLKLDAVNLRKDRDTFIRLQRKLSLLWGDLEERKSAGIDILQKSAYQLPFNCCVKEWGVKCACTNSNGHRSDDAQTDRECAVIGPEHNKECLGWERRFALFGTTINED